MTGLPQYPDDWATKLSALERRVNDLYTLAASRIKVNTMAAGLTADTVATQDGTASGTYVALSVPGPAVTVTIGSAGRAVVIVGCQIISNATKGGSMGFAVSGATTLAEDISRAYIQDVGAASGLAGSRAVVLTGLTPGVNTFTAMYASGGGTVLFRDRDLVVIPF